MLRPSLRVAAGLGGHVLPDARRVAVFRLRVTDLAGADACSTRALSAVFICSKPVSVFASVPLKSPTRRPLKLSDWTKPAAAAVERLDSEAVFAVEDAGEQEAAEPTQFAARLDGANGWPEGHRPSSWRFDSYFELRALMNFAADRADERIPLRVGSEVGHDCPHALRRALISTSRRSSRISRESCTRSVGSLPLATRVRVPAVPLRLARCSGGGPGRAWRQDDLENPLP